MELALKHESKDMCSSRLRRNIKINFIIFFTESKDLLRFVLGMFSDLCCWCPGFTDLKHKFLSLAVGIVFFMFFQCSSFVSVFIEKFSVRIHHCMKITEVDARCEKF